MSWSDVLLALPDMADFLGGVAGGVPLSFGIEIQYMGGGRGSTVGEEEGE